VIPLGLLLVAVAWLAIGRSGEGQAGGATRSEVRTAEVQRRTLAEQVTVDGTIGYAGKGTVVNRLSGTVTSLPSVGDVIRRGQDLFAVDDEPVNLMYGELPAYRRLAEGVSSGEDVRQLERNLSALGYDPGTVDEEFTSTTADAVSTWQDDLGLRETGAVELGRVVFLPSARRVTDISATLGSDGGSGGTASGVAANPSAATSDESALVAYHTDVQTTVEETGGDAPAAGTGEEPGSGEQPNQGTPSTQTPTTTTPAQTASPETPAASTDGGGDAADAPSTPVLETSSTRRIVTAELDADQQSLVSRGRRVTVTLPDGRQAPGKVSRVEAVSASSDQSTDPTAGSSEPMVEATIELIGRGRIPALDGAAVSVTLTDEVRRDVLTVPLTALISIGGDRFAVISRDGSRRRQIVVTPGLAAEGYLEVEGKGLREGMAVEAPE
jgi:hypothetical protein